MIMTRGRKAYQITINIILILITLVMVLPLVLLFMSSITDENTLIVNGYSFFPQKFSLDAYGYIIKNASSVFRAYGITIRVTAIGTLGSLILTSMVAFPLSLKDLPGKKYISFYVFFTILFSGEYYMGIYNTQFFAKCIQHNTGAHLLFHEYSQRYI